jgi:hypothetical protein
MLSRDSQGAQLLVHEFESGPYISLNELHLVFVVRG